MPRGRICRLQLLLAFASAVIFDCWSRGTRDRILLYQSRDFPFRRLLRLSGNGLLCTRFENTLIICSSPVFIWIVMKIGCQDVD
jgi:hypothetical protein